MIAPEFTKASATLNGKARFAKVDTEAFAQAGQHYGIRGIPLMIAFRGGHEVKRQAGAMPAAGIINWVSDLAEKRARKPFILTEVHKENGLGTSSSRRE